MKTLERLNKYCEKIQTLSVNPNEDALLEVKKEWSKIWNLYETENYLLLDPDAPQKGDWLAVIDDSDCLLGLGGAGKIYLCEGQCKWDFSCWILKGVSSPYSKKIFRKATKKEVSQHHANIA